MQVGFPEISAHDSNGCRSPSDYAVSVTPPKLLLWLLLALSIIASTSCAPRIQRIESVDAVPIEFLQSGAGRTTLVFVHGWTGDRSSWINQVPEFSKNYRVIALDLGGFGRSGTGRKEWTMEAYGSDVSQVVRRLSADRVILVGHSMGSAAVLEAALELPKRVIGVVTVDVLQEVERRFTESEIGDEITRRTPYVESEAGRRGLESVPEVWTESLREYFRWRSNTLLHTLEALQAPLFSINSDRFETNVDMARKYAPSFSVRLVEGVGHGVMIEAPERFNDVLSDILRILEASPP